MPTFSNNDKTVNQTLRLKQKLYTVASWPVTFASQLTEQHLLIGKSLWNQNKHVLTAKMNERKWQQPWLQPLSPVVEGSQVSWHITVYCTVSLRKMMQVCYDLFKLFVNSKCTKCLCFPITFLCVLHAQSVRFCFILIIGCNTATIQKQFFF